MKQWNMNGVLPLIAVVAIVVVLAIGLMIVLFLTLKMILVLILGGAGLYLLLKPNVLAGMPPWARIGVPLMLMFMAVLVYSEVLEV